MHRLNQLKERKMLFWGKINLDKDPKTLCVCMYVDSPVIERVF